MQAAFQPELMTIADFGAWARMGRTRIYEEIGSGALESFTIGRRRYIRVAAAQAWLACHLGGQSTPEVQG